jgi:hypothetical protein
MKLYAPKTGSNTERMFAPKMPALAEKGRRIAAVLVKRCELSEIRHPASLLWAA